MDAKGSRGRSPRTRSKPADIGSIAAGPPHHVALAASSIPAEPPPVFLAKWGTTGAGGSQFNRPYGVAVDASGNVYVAEFQGNRVQKFDGNGAFLTKWGMNGSGNGDFLFPAGVTLDAWGNVFVVDTNNDRIQKFAGPWLEIFIGEPEPPASH